MTWRSSPKQLASYLPPAAVAAFLLLSPFALAQQPATFAPRVTFAWDANSEADLAGYLLVIQSPAGSVTNTVGASATSCAFQPPPNLPGPWTVTLRAFNTAGMLSEPSEPLVLKAPDRPLGLRVSLAIELTVGEAASKQAEPTFKVISVGSRLMSGGQSRDQSEWKTEAP